jgi:hypothetical protein
VTSGVGVTRRNVLGVGASLVAGAVLPTATAGATTRDFGVRETFDALDRGYYGGNGRKGELNERRGALAWDEAYVLQAYVLMLETYRDTCYADKLVDHLDHVLATRDSVRGVSAFPGRSLPAWRCTSPYNVGEAVLSGDDGEPLVRLRCSGGSAEQVTVTVTRSTPDTFDLVARRATTTSASSPGVTEARPWDLTAGRAGAGPVAGPGRVGPDVPAAAPGP